MTPAEIKAACLTMGLTQRQLAALLDIPSKGALVKMMADPGTPTHRPPAARVVRLIKAYLAGYRPDDWPQPP